MSEARPSLIASLREWSEMVAKLPPRPWCIKASHAVPFGRVYRQWDTRGRLIVWANRGEIEDIPCRAATTRDGYAIAPNAIDIELLTSIPVVKT
jgi:hypothetical protein